MNYEDVKIPMVVRMLSDNVPMTAIDKREVSGKKQVLCQWRDRNGNVVEATFDPVGLVPVVEEDNSIGGLPFYEG